MSLFSSDIFVPDLTFADYLDSLSDPDRLDDICDAIGSILDSLPPTIYFAQSWSDGASKIYPDNSAVKMLKNRKRTNSFIAVPYPDQVRIIAKCEGLVDIEQDDIGVHVQSIALAQAHSGTVVTDDTRALPFRLSVAEGCRKNGVDYCSVDEFIKRLGI